MASKKSFKNENPALAFMSTDENTPDQGKNTQQQEIPEGYKINPMYIETKSKRVQLLLQPSVVAAIKDLAKSKGLSMNEAVSIALKEYLAREGK